MLRYGISYSKAKANANMQKPPSSTCTDCYVACDAASTSVDDWGSEVFASPSPSSASPLPMPLMMASPSPCVDEAVPVPWVEVVPPLIPVAVAVAFPVSSLAPKMVEAVCVPSCCEPAGRSNGDRESKLLPDAKLALIACPTLRVDVVSSVIMMIPKPDPKAE
jgi:hypothetical protein